MILLLIAIVVVGFSTNILFYELRVIKGLFKDPQYITDPYQTLKLRGKYGKKSYL